MQFKTLLVAAIGATTVSAQTAVEYSSAYTALQTAVNSVQTQLNGLEAAAQSTLQGSALIAAYSSLEESAASHLTSLYASFDTAWGGVTATPTASSVTGALSTASSASGASATSSSSESSASSASSRSSSSGTATGTAATTTSSGAAAAVGVPAFAGLLAFLAAAL